MSFRPQINFSQEQEMLLDIAEKFAKDKSPLEVVRKKIAAAQPFDETLWQEIVALGWAGLTLDEADGGSGLGLGEAVAIIEPMGRQLFATPLVKSIIAAEIAQRLEAKAPRAKALARAIAEGAQVALALNEPQGNWELDDINATAKADGDRFLLHGTKTLITHADSAQFMLVLALLDARPHFFVLERAQFEQAIVKEKVVDETQSSFRLSLDGIALDKEKCLGVMSGELKQEIERQLSLLLTAQMCGGIAGVLELVVEYLKTRKQFNKYIGSYQALKHPTVDILLGLEAARSHLYYAAGLAPSQEACVAAHMAKAQASDAFTFAADRAVQFHGAFGFTYDCDAQLFLRRALWCEYQMGDAAYHRQKIAHLTL